MDSFSMNPCLSIYDLVSDELQAAIEHKSTILFNPDIDTVTFGDEDFGFQINRGKAISEDFAG